MPIDHMTICGALVVVKRINHLLAKSAVICAIRPGAEAVRGWRALNRSTVCTVGAVAPGAGFSRFKMRVSQVHSRRVRFCRSRDNKLEEGDFQEA
jgi:hypothetical protein